MSDNKAKALRIFRQLTPKHQADLLAWVKLAHVAENSVRKSMNFDVSTDLMSFFKLQDDSCRK